MFRQTLQRGESRDMATNGNYIRVDDGVVEVVTNHGHRWRLAQNEGVRVAEFNRITITNVGAAGVVAVRCGYGVLQGSTGDTIAVSEIMTPVEIDSSTPVAVAVQGTADVQVTTPVEIDDSTPVAVAVQGTADVQVTAPVEIDSSTPVAVAVQGTADVQVTAPVEIDDSTPVAVAVQGNTGLSAIADTTLTAGVSAQLVAAGSRKSIKIKSPSSNTGPVRIGGAGVGAAAGYELDPGESVTLETGAAIHAWSATAETLTAVEVL